MIRYIILATGLLITSSARADLPSWSVDGGPVVVLLGGRNPTGGLGVAATGIYHIQLTDSLSLHPGLDVVAFGLSGQFHWISAVIGPEVGASWRGEHWTVEAAGGAGYGRTSVCNDWTLCLRYWGLYPIMRSAIGYELRPFGAAVGITARYVDTLGWTGISWQPEIRARLIF